MPRALASCVSFSLKTDPVILCNVLTEQELLDCAFGVYAILFPGGEVFQMIVSLSSLDRKLVLAHPQEDHFVKHPAKNPPPVKRSDQCVCLRNKSHFLVCLFSCREKMNSGCGKKLE